LGRGYLSREKSSDLFLNVYKAAFGWIGGYFSEDIFPCIAVMLVVIHSSLWVMCWCSRPARVDFLHFYHVLISFHRWHSLVLIVLSLRLIEHSFLFQYFQTLRPFTYRFQAVRSNRCKCSLWADIYTGSLPRCADVFFVLQCVAEFFYRWAGLMTFSSLQTDLSSYRHMVSSRSSTYPVWECRNPPLSVLNFRNRLILDYRYNSHL